MADDLLAQANSAFVDEQYEKSLSLYTDAIQAGPPTAQLYSKRAANLLKLGQVTRALSDILSGLQLEPDNPMLNFRKGFVVIFPMLDIKPSKLTCFLCSLALFEAGRFLEAQDSFSKSKDLGCVDADRWIAKCELHTEGVVSQPTPESNLIIAENGNKSDVPVQPSTLASKTRDNFYDNKTYLVYTVYAKGLKSDDIKVDFVDEKNVTHFNGA